MRNKLIFVILGLLIFKSAYNQQIYSQSAKNKYGLKVISDYQEYIKSVAEDSSNALLNIKDYIPDIILDIKYATKENFLGEVVYSQSLAFTRKPVVEALIKVQQELNTKNLGLKIYDAYRPYAVTVYFYEKIQDSVFVAAPWKGSRHNRGCAVDFTLVNLKTGKELEMPTKFDDFTESAHPDYMNLSDEAIQNRNILITAMEKYGFKVYYAEWWHFDFTGWEKYDLMDITFEKLINQK